MGGNASGGMVGGKGEEKKGGLCMVRGVGSASGRGVVRKWTCTRVEQVEKQVG